MSLQRPLSTSTLTIFKFAPTYVPRPRPNGSRQFTSSLSVRLSAKRRLVTTTEYRPSSLDPPFPPRNSLPTDTSTSRGFPLASQARSTPPKLEEPAQTSLNEAEAQRAKPVEHAQTQSTSETSSQPRKTKLRPRKAAITLTPEAISHLKDMLSQPDPKLIRVGVKNRGCSGLAYHLEYVDKAGAFDETVEQEGVKVLIDSKALFSIIGSEMDWAEDDLKQRFVFRNPNISKYRRDFRSVAWTDITTEEQCGCGESFMV